MNILTRTCFVLLQTAIIALAVSCSNTDESDEKSSVEKTTDKIAQDAVDMINKPINEAKQIENLGNDHALRLKEAANQE